MKRFLYFVCLVLIVGSGLAVVLYYGDQPSPISKLELSRFQDPEAFAGTLSEKLREDLKKSPVLLLGVMPESPEGFEVAEKFLANLKESEVRYDVVVVEPGLGPEGFMPDAASVSLQKEVGRLAEGIRNAQAQSLRTVVIAPSEITTQLGEITAADKLKDEFKIEAMSLSIVPFPIARNEEKSFPIPCHTESQDRSGMGSLGCVIFQIARTTYKTDKDPARYSGKIDQVGERDFIALFHPPLLKEIEK